MRRASAAGLTAFAVVALVIVAPAPPPLSAVTAPAPAAAAHTVVPASWTVQPSPDAGTSAINELAGVSCIGPSFCVAVGQQSANPQTQPLAETYDGTGWSMASPAIPSTSYASYFFGVSCVSPSFCAAVGVTYPSGEEQDFAEVWNGSTWTVTPAPSPFANQNASLDAVSCVSATLCTAVGGSGTGTADENVVEVWNGTTWSIVPDAELSPPDSDLSGVSCLSVTFCEAVGTRYSPETPFAETWNGSTWTADAMPALSGSVEALLLSVSCTSPTMCLASGYNDRTGSPGNLVEQWNGTTWSVMAVPQPAAPEIGFAESVDCFGPTSCVVVGQGGLGFGAGTVEVLTWDGTTWTMVPAPSPGSSSIDALTGVSCVAGYSCVGVGYVGATEQTLVLSAPVARSGYDEVASDGGIFSFAKPFYGSTGSMHLNRPVVGMAVTPDGGGYWLVASDGGIFSYGDAAFYGSTGSMTLNAPVVGMASTADGRGYWLVASDGGIFAFGDAVFYGSMGAKPLNKPIVGMAATPDGLGYLLVASDGGIFAFGDAVFSGSMGGQPLNEPIVGMAVTATGGYYEVASDGGLFAFGAPFLGSMGAKPLNKPIVAMALTAGGGYYEVASDGGIFAFGAPFLGSMGGQPLNEPIVGAAV